MLLSGGSLTLSISYLDEIAGPHPSHKLLLVLAWLSFVLCLSFTLFSMYSSAEAVLAATGEYPFSNTTAELGGSSSRLVVWFNRFAAAAVAVGLALLAVFAFLNMK